MLNPPIRYRRARRTDFTAIDALLRAAGAADGAGAFLTHSGWRSVGDQFEFDLAEAAQRAQPQ